MYTPQWHRGASRKRLRSMHEALFVLEKNAFNLGSSNKSLHGILEHKHALEILKEFSDKIKEKKELQATPITENLITLLDPSESSALSLLNPKESTEFRMKTLELMTGLLSGEKSKNNRHMADTLIKNDIAGVIIHIIETKPIDIEVLGAMKRLYLAIFHVVPFTKLSKKQRRKFMSLAIKLMKMLSKEGNNKTQMLNENLVDFVFKRLQAGLDLSENLIRKVKVQLIRHLIRTLHVKQTQACEKLLTFSENDETCDIILKEDGVNQIVKKCLTGKHDQQTKRTALKVIKNILKNVNEETGISLYEEILRLGDVKSLDDFVGVSKTNKTFRRRMLKQQNLQQTIMRTKIKKSVKAREQERMSVNSSDL